MSDRSPTFLICKRVDSGPSGVAGSTIRVCSHCLARVHFAPSSESVLVPAHPDAAIVCIPCAFRVAVATGGFDDVRVHDEQIDEVLANLPADEKPRS